MARQLAKGYARGTGGNISGSAEKVRKGQANQKRVADNAKRRKSKGGAGG